MTKISAKVIKDSISPANDRITTLEVVMPRMLVAEFNTHRKFSRNSASSRAIPQKTIRASVLANMFVPPVFYANKSGMQGGEPCKYQKLSKFIWKLSGKLACLSHWMLEKTGAHKQHTNRILEPYMWTKVLVTSTDWGNFFALRDHHMAQPEFQTVAREMRMAINSSLPEPLGFGQWHTPYADASDEHRIKRSVARCARVSYKREGQTSLEEDLSLYNRLLNRGANEPQHSSPAEHVATVSYGSHYNLDGWKSWRWVLDYPREEDNNALLKEYDK